MNGVAGKIGGREIRVQKKRVGGIILRVGRYLGVGFGFKKPPRKESVGIAGAGGEEGWGSGGVEERAGGGFGFWRAGGFGG